MPLPESTLSEPDALARDMPTTLVSPGGDWLIDASGVRKKYCRDLRRSLWYGVRDVADALTLRPSRSAVLREHEFWAVDDVSFQLRRGESLGLLGRNGAGKSTLLKLLTGQRSLSAGTIATRGRIVALNELGLGFDPTLTGRENAYVNAAVLGLSRRRFDALIEDIIDFSGIREFIDSAVQTYSTGMKARLGFSVATHLDPDILIVDEVLAVGDLEFRRKCVKHVLAYVRRGGSLMLVAHDPFLVQSMCTRCIVLDRGKIVFDGSGIEGVNFHFRLGHTKQYALIAEAAERVLGDAASEESSTEYPEAAARTVDLEPISSTPQTFLVELSASQPVIVDHIEVLAESGGSLYTGHPAKVIMKCRSNSPHEIVWGFTLCTADLQTNIAACAKGLDGHVSRLETGENTLVCRLPELPLQPGVYAIRGGIADAATLVVLAVLGYEDKPGFFTIAAAEVNRTNNWQMDQSNLVAMKAEWIS